jgi:hypothetical protein
VRVTNQKSTWYTELGFRVYPPPSPGCPPHAAPPSLPLLPRLPASAAQQPRPHAAPLLPLLAAAPRPSRGHPRLARPHACRACTSTGRAPPSPSARNAGLRARATEGGGDEPLAAISQEEAREEAQRRVRPHRRGAAAPAGRGEEAEGGCGQASEDVAEEAGDCTRRRGRPLVCWSPAADRTTSTHSCC